MLQRGLRKFSINSNKHKKEEEEKRPAGGISTAKTDATEFEGPKSAKLRDSKKYNLGQKTTAGILSNGSSLDAKKKGLYSIKEENH